MSSPKSARRTHPRRHLFRLDHADFQTTSNEMSQSRHRFDSEIHPAAFIEKLGDILSAFAPAKRELTLGFPGNFKCFENLLNVHTFQDIRLKFRVVFKPLPSGRESLSVGVRHRRDLRKVLLKGVGQIQIVFNGLLG